MKTFFLIFPVIFCAFVFFFGFISFSILIKKKPVIVSSKIILILITIALLPSIFINLMDFKYSGFSSLIQLIIPVMFSFLIIFYLMLLKGISIYGINDDDFRKYLFLSLDSLGIKYTEKLNKIHLDELQTDLNIAFQEMLGTGTIKPKNRKKVNFKSIVKAFKSLIRDNEIVVKKITAYFYLVFSIIMLLTTIVFTYFIFTKIL